jgi:hypothetical protein
MVWQHMDIDTVGLLSVRQLGLILEYGASPPPLSLPRPTPSKRHAKLVEQIIRGCEITEYWLTRVGCEWCETSVAEIEPPESWDEAPPAWGSLR